MTADVTLYLVTDPDLLGRRPLCEVVEEAIEGGVTMVQLRNKRAGGGDLLSAARALLEVTRPRRIPLIINDRVDVMLAAEADGVHVGATDLPLEYVRRLAPTAIVGYSVNTRADLETATRYGADYIGIGPAFPTRTKTDARTVLGPDGIARLARPAPMPAAAIGGITPANVAGLRASGVQGICVVSAIMGAAQPAAAARHLRALWSAGKTGVR